MALQGSIPEDAMSVVQTLRQDVPRPRVLPKYWYHGGNLRWKSPSPSFTRRCPMGLHPKSTSAVPISNYAFADGEHTQEAVTAFYEWWDAQTDAKAAVDAVWPRKKRTKKCR